MTSPKFAGPPAAEDLDFGAYVAARWAGFVRATVLFGCPAQDAEDLVQTALARCYQSWDKVCDARNPDGYVYQVLLNCYSKSRARHWWTERITSGEELNERAPLSPDIAEHVVTTQVLREALGELSFERRVVLILKYYADFSEQQIAELLVVPIGTVKSRAARALQQLMEQFDQTSSMSIGGQSD